MASHEWCSSGISAGGVEPLRKAAAADAPVVLPEPAAWMLGCQTMGGWKLSFSQPGAGVRQRLKGEEFEERLYTEQQVRALLTATQPAAQGLDAQTTRDAVIQHLTSAGVLEHDG